MPFPLFPSNVGEYYWYTDTRVPIFKERNMSLGIQQLAAAVSEGNLIQARPKGSSDPWVDLSKETVKGNLFDLKYFEYRVKPETSDMWVFWRKGDQYPLVFWTEKNAREFFDQTRASGKFFTMDIYRNCEQPESFDSPQYEYESFDSVSVQYEEDDDKGEESWQSKGKRLDNFGLEPPNFKKRKKRKLPDWVTELKHDFDLVSSEMDISYSEYDSWNSLGFDIDCEIDEGDF